MFHRYKELSSIAINYTYFYNFLQISVRDTYSKLIKVFLKKFQHTKKKPAQLLALYLFESKAERGKKVYQNPKGYFSLYLFYLKKKAVYAHYCTSTALIFQSDLV